MRKDLNRNLTHPLLIMAIMKIPKEIQIFVVKSSDHTYNLCHARFNKKGFIWVVGPCDFVHIAIAICKGIWNPGKFCLWNSESWALESGIQLKEFGSHYRLESGIHIPLTKNPESGTWNPESTTWSTESKTVLDSLTWGNILTDNLSIRWSGGEKVIFTWTANQASAFHWWCYHLKMTFVVEWPRFP